MYLRRSPLSARAVLPYDRPTDERLCYRHTAAAAVGQIQSQVVRPHLVAMLQHNWPPSSQPFAPSQSQLHQQKGRSLQDPNTKQRRLLWRQQRIIAVDRLQWREQQQWQWHRQSEQLHYLVICIILIRRVIWNVAPVSLCVCALGIPVFIVVYVFYTTAHTTHKTNVLTSYFYACVHNDNIYIYIYTYIYMHIFW